MPMGPGGVGCPGETNTALGTSLPQATSWGIIEVLSEISDTKF